jgi:hypothetical protein
VNARALVWTALRVAAAALLVSTAVAAVHDASQAWDVWYYHMPFAARLAGIVGPDQYVFDAANTARFEGFPLLGEVLQGALWRITGRPEAANLVALASVPLFALFLRMRFGVAARLTVLALLAVPLVHVHASSSYVDLPANAALAGLVLCAIQAWGTDAPDARALGWGVAFAAFAVNTKTLLQPLVLLALAALALRTGPPLFRAARRSMWARGAVAALVLALPVVFATPIKNVARHGNPWYPVRVEVPGHVFPGPDGPYRSSPDWLARAPQPARFGASLLEIGLRPLRDRRRWTVDQWTPPEHDGYRMGGFFGAYVVVLLALLAWRVATDRGREVRAAAIGFAALSVVIAVMPQSHELRYYLAWMIVLVALDLWLACLPSASGPGRYTLGALAVLALAVVLAVTRAAYVRPTGSTFRELVRAKVDERLLDGVRDGERVCIDRAPFTFLWAAPFHPPRRYVVAEAGRASGCAGGRVLE